MKQRISESIKDKLKSFAKAAYERGKMDNGSSSDSSKSSHTPSSNAVKKPGLLSRIKNRLDAHRQAKHAPSISQTPKGATLDFTKTKPTTRSLGSSSSVASFKIQAIKSNVKKAVPKSTPSSSAPEAPKSPVASAPEKKRTTSPKPAAKKRTTKKEVKAKETEKLLNPPPGLSDTGRRNIGEAADPDKKAAKKTLRDIRRRSNASLHKEPVQIHVEQYITSVEFENDLEEEFNFSEVQNKKTDYSHSLSVHAKHKNKKDHVMVDLQRHHTDPEGHWRLNDVRKVDKSGKPVRLTYDHSHAGTVGAKGMRSIARHLNSTYGIKTVRAMRITGASARGKEPHEMPKKTYRIGEALYAGLSSIITEQE